MRIKKIAMIAAVATIVSIPAYAYADEMNVSVDVGNHGTVNEHSEDFSETVSSDTSYEVNIKSDEGYVIHSVLVNDEPVTGILAQPVEGEETASIELGEVGSDVDITAVFRAKEPSDENTTTATGTAAAGTAASDSTVGTTTGSGTATGSSAETSGTPDSTTTGSSAETSGTADGSTTGSTENDQKQSDTTSSTGNDQNGGTDQSTATAQDTAHGTAKATDTDTSKNTEANTALASNTAQDDAAGTAQNTATDTTQAAANNTDQPDENNTAQNAGANTDQTEYSEVSGQRGSPKTGDDYNLRTAFLVMLMCSVFMTISSLTLRRKS